jgi:non-ribosomal peptide synthetase component F
MDTPFAGIDCLTTENQVLFNQYSRGSTADVPIQLLHHLFEMIADAQPFVTAVEHNGQIITYGQLEVAANILANQLLARGLLPRQRVCLVVQRSIDMVIAILAILKCGCQYVPLDGGVIPQKSLVHVVVDTEAPFILCTKKFEARVREAAECRSVIVLDDSAEDQHLCFTRPQVESNGEDGAYVIYTSG